MTNIGRQFWFITRGATFIICVAVSSQLFAAAANQYCGNAINQHHISVSTGKLETSTLDTGTEVAFSRNELNSGITVNSKQNHLMAVDFNFQYTIVGFDETISPMTNGHLHSWDFPVSWHRKGADHTLDYYLAPVISVSSNVLKKSRSAGPGSIATLDRHDL